MTLFQQACERITQTIHELRSTGVRAKLTNVGSDHKGEWHYELVHDGVRVRVTVEVVDY